ncbi:MAG: hypothetical protein ABIA63_09050 [bacterium]
MDLALLNSSGKIIEITKKRITFQEFSRLIRDIDSGYGLLFDDQA